MDAVTSLAQQECIPCTGEGPALQGHALQMFLNRLENGWSPIHEHHLEKEFEFPDFAQALAFTNRVGALAEAQNHHPEILLSWGRVLITIWTHKLNGLTESDFVLAAKIERVPR